MIVFSSLSFHTRKAPPGREALFVCALLFWDFFGLQNRSAVCLLLQGFLFFLELIIQHGFLGFLTGFDDLQRDVVALVVDVLEVVRLFLAAVKREFQPLCGFLHFAELFRAERLGALFGSVPDTV